MLKNMENQLSANEYLAKRKAEKLGYTGKYREQDNLAKIKDLIREIEKQYELNQPNLNTVQELKIQINRLLFS